MMKLRRIAQTYNTAIELRDALDKKLKENGLSYFTDWFEIDNVTKAIPIKAEDIMTIVTCLTDFINFWDDVAIDNFKTISKEEEKE